MSLAETVKTEIATHVLTLSPDYVADWKFWEATRELLQNAIDQHKACPHSAVIFDYEKNSCNAAGIEGFLTPSGHEVDIHIHLKESGTLTIGSTNAYLSPKTLLMGGGTKSLDERLIGQFGEGYKLALLVLLRTGHEVTIYNGEEIWRPKFLWNVEFQSELLTIVREHNTEEDIIHGVVFEIGNVSQKDYDSIAENYLADCKEDTILDADHLRKRVFVSGLFVCEIEELEYGYNFSPRRLKLDRDRRTAPTFDVSYASSRLWDQSGDNERFYKNYSAAGLDTTYSTVEKPETRNFFVQQYLAETPTAIPVSTDDEGQRLIKQGKIVRRVPTALKSLLHHAHQFVFEKEDTPTQKIEKFQQTYAHQLNKEAQDALKALLKESLKWRS